jgi:hypothetical protein
VRRAVAGRWSVEVRVLSSASTTREPRVMSLHATPLIVFLVR